MPYVIIDTNTLMADYLLIEANMQTFLRGCQRCHITVCFPEIVIDELIGNYKKDITRLIKEYDSASRKLKRMGVDATTTDLNIEKETEDFRIHIHQMIEHHGVKLISYPSISSKALVEASYSGRKPFKDSGDGFKDFLVFESLRTVAAKQSDEGWFITANSKDFCDASGQLHPDLQSVLREKVAVFRNVHEFNAAVVSPNLEVLEDITSRIRGGQFKGFDLDRALTDLFIKELCDKYHSLATTGTPLDEPTVVSVGAPKTNELTVSRLEKDELLFELSGEIELELSGFIQKSDYYAMSESESEEISVDDGDWNDHVILASTTRDFKFSMTVIFDEAENQPDSVSIEIEPVEDEFG